MAKRAAAPLAGTIRSLRERLGLTQRAFAERLQVPQSTVYRWESGGASPRGDSLARLGGLAASSGLALEMGPLAAARPAGGAGPRARIVAATCRLLEEELAFCRVLEEAKGDAELGASAWETLGETLAAHRLRISEFLLEAAKAPPERFNFWKAVGLLKVFAWKAQANAANPMAVGYVNPGQLSPEAPRVRR